MKDLENAMANLKPNKPEPFSGKRDAVTVNAWLYQVDMYLNLLQLNNPEAPIDQNTRVSFASTLLKGYAANWWYMLVQSGQAPSQWDAFVAKVRIEFIPQDSVDRARDRLRSLRQRTSVTAYLNEFRNTVISIPGISEDEKLDKFVAGLKPEVMIDVRKSRPADLESAAQTALTVDSALFSTGMYAHSTFRSGSSSDPQPMDIGNVEGRTHYRGRAFKPNRARSKLSKKEIDLARQSKCFVCHKKGCRSWKHDGDDNEAIHNNTRADADSGSESEN